MDFEMNFERLIKGMEEDIINKVGKERFDADDAMVEKIYNAIMPLALLASPPAFGTAMSMIIDEYCEAHEEDTVEFLNKMTAIMDITKKITDAVHNMCEDGKEND